MQLNDSSFAISLVIAKSERAINKHMYARIFFREETEGAFDDEAIISGALHTGPSCAFCATIRL